MLSTVKHVVSFHLPHKPVWHQKAFILFSRLGVTSTLGSESKSIVACRRVRVRIGCEEGKVLHGVPMSGLQSDSGGKFWS